ncbi:MAG: translation elongation factor Ts [Deltaproteobacteria bacterium]|nr:translation elongation factor Ts [Deltaproteobacteria bacterium]
MEITAQSVKELRDKTGAGMMDCKKALAECMGDCEKAAAYLREKGLATARKKAGRTTREGLVTSYIHGGGKVGVLVETNCETDFVAKTTDFQNLTKDVAMHIAAMNPLYVRREDVPSGVVEKEKGIFRAQVGNKPPSVMEKVIEGKIEKFFKETCLLDQEFVKNPDMTVGDLIRETVSKLGENIQVGRFARFKVGEGAEKAEEKG